MRTLLAAAALFGPSIALACGCFHSPEPEPEEVDFAVNQQAEQIIFEVEDGFVTAHVLIKYQGDPEAFGWIVPVPNLPELSLSENTLFALLDENTAPSLQFASEDRCPDPLWRCEQHPPPENCEYPAGPDAALNSDAGFNGGGGEGGAGGAGGGGPGAVQILGREQIGAYDTVTLAADDADAVVNWLNTEGFIVNETMAPYMQPYLDANMLFVASRLIPDADVSEIRPLKMRYRAEFPMVPIQLTAIASEPHLTVTSYVFGDATYAPRDQPLVSIPEDWLSWTEGGRANYPMALSRAADTADGRGFILEYADQLPAIGFNLDTGCRGDQDFCQLGDDEVCQCPRDEFDAADCEAGGVAESVRLYDALRAYPSVSRLTTRLSPEEMTFDPIFMPTQNAEPEPRRRILSRDQIGRCTDDVMEPGALSLARVQERCSATYCGRGTCVVGALDVGCECDQGYVARAFTDLDGQRSVTCVPAVGTVDLAAGGIEIPDVCGGVDCGLGRCVEIGGFAACDCAEEAAGILVRDRVVCAAKLRDGVGPGAQRQTAYRELDICAPRPRSCGRFGWLVPNDRVELRGEVCARSTPDDALTLVPQPPSCEDFGWISAGPDGGAGGQGGIGGQAGAGGQAGQGGAGGQAGQGGAGGAGGIGGIGGQAGAGGQTRDAGADALVPTDDPKGDDGGCAAMGAQPVLVGGLGLFLLGLGRRRRGVR